VKLNDTQVAVLSLVRRYVARQELVQDALRDLRPDLLFRRDQMTGGQIEQLLTLTKTYSGVPQRGNWGQEGEWSYFIHGGGCRLVHRVTAEPIDWDAPETVRFDKYSLLNYFEWLLKQDVADKSVSIVRSQLIENNTPLHDFLFSILEQLRQLGVLANSGHDNKYLLLSDNHLAQQIQNEQSE
jgi:hypothetical protein